LRGHRRQPQRTGRGDRCRHALRNHDEHLHDRRGFPRSCTHRAGARRRAEGPRRAEGFEGRRSTRGLNESGDIDMREITLADFETAIKSITATALKNEQYFCELDSYAGDADFGLSLASGFRVVSKEWNELDRSSIGSFLQKISMIMMRNVGGCSGPIWGT